MASGWLASPSQLATTYLGGKEKGSANVQGQGKDSRLHMYSVLLLHSHHILL